MRNPVTYQPANTVAPFVEKHFNDTLALAGDLGTDSCRHIPSAEVIQTLVDTIFWTSLRKEEGYSPKTSLAYVSPEQSKQPIIFEKPLPLSPSAISKLAPAVERPGIQLGVWHGSEGLQIWGATRELPPLGMVVEVVEPGMIVIKHKRVVSFGKFYNVAVLKGDEIKLVDETKAGLPDSPAILNRLLSFSAIGSLNDQEHVMLQLSVSMRAHGRGGTLLIVPSHTKDWRKSIIQPVTYTMNPAFTKLSKLVMQNPENEDQSLLRLAIDGIAGLTAADGATILNDRYELLAFGAKIGMAENSTRVERMISTEPVVGNNPQVMHPAQNGGTRHLSATQFVHDQRDALALVASQDGKFTIFAWSELQKMVQAHRVDVLFL